MAKYDWEQIRAEFEAGSSQSELSRKYGVSRAAIQKHIEAEVWIFPVEVIKRKAYESEQKRMQRRKRAKENEKIKKKFKDEAKKETTISNLAKQGIVYLISCEIGKNKWYKIGIAKNLKARLAVIQTGCPLEIYLIGAKFFQNARLEEYLLHDRFSEKNIRGEWFVLSDSDVEFIKEKLNG